VTLYYQATLFLALLSNMFTNLNLTDMEVCYAVIRQKVIQGVNLRSDRFGFEPELTANVARFLPSTDTKQLPAPLPDRRDLFFMSRQDVR